MSNIIIYRVENDDNMGPYNIKGLFDCGNEELANMYFVHCDQPRTHPSPSMDGISFMSGIDVCGFSTFEQMCDWFNGYGDVLNRYGFRVNEYSIPEIHVQMGGRQATVDVTHILRHKPIASYSTIGL